MNCIHHNINCVLHEMYDNNSSDLNPADLCIIYTVITFESTVFARKIIAAHHIYFKEMARFLVITPISFFVVYKSKRNLWFCMMMMKNAEADKATWNQTRLTVADPTTQGKLWKRHFFFLQFMGTQTEGSLQMEHAHKPMGRCFCALLTVRVWARDNAPRPQTRPIMEEAGQNK